MSVATPETRHIVGIQPVREAIAAHGSGLRVMIERSDSPTLEALARFAKDRGAEVKRVARSELDRTARGLRHQGVIAVAPALTLVDIDALVLRDPALVVVLDELEDPQNFGAILRSSVALGADAILWPEHHSAPLSPATFRASAGAVEHAQLCRVTSVTTALATLQARGLVRVALDSNAKMNLSEVSLTSPVAIVIGAEGKGIRRPVRAACDHVARIPLHGPIASLNASVAAALALYEVARQRDYLPASSTISTSSTSK